MSRGQIVFRDRARQIRDFSGLLFNTITPTDIDGLIEYHDKAYILIELKYGDSPISEGQKLALERLTDDLRKVGKLTLCIIARHDNADPKDDIDVAQCIVSRYRLNKE